MKLEIERQCNSCGQLVKPIVDDGFDACPECGVVNEGFEELVSTMSAEQVIARIRLLEGRAEGIGAQYKIVVDSLKKEKERAERRLEVFLTWAKPILQTYFHAHRPAKKKSLVLAGTTIGFRTTGGKLKLAEDGGVVKGDPTDRETMHAALKWALENKPELVKQEVSLKLNDLVAWMNTQVAEGKEIEVPGVEKTPLEETFFIR